MNTHTFVPGAEQLVVDLNPPANATACVIQFTAREGGIVPAGGVRLAHVRLAHPAKHPGQSADAALPRETEICELIVRNGVVHAGFSGFGGKHAIHPVQHLGDAPGSFPVGITIPLTGQLVIVSAGRFTASSDTDIAPGERPMQLLLGMAPLAHGDGVNQLSPPLGWTFDWEDDAVSWLTTGDTTKPTPASPTATTPLMDLVKAELAARGNLDPVEAQTLTALLGKLLGGG